MNGEEVETDPRGEDSQQLPAEGGFGTPQEAALSQSAPQPAGRHQCPVCSRQFSRPSRLAKHMAKHPGVKPPTGERPFGCTLCPKRFASRTGLDEHQRNHAEDKLHACSFCQKLFSTPSSFRDHVRIHTGQKPHRCSLCGKSYNRPGLLRKHLQKHGVQHDEQRGVSPPAAAQDSSGASESLVSPDVLQLTEDAVCGLINSDGEEEDWRPLDVPGGDGGGGAKQQAAGGGNRKHCCPVCGRDCFKASALQKHLRIHSGERPFQCPTCSKSFTQQVHMKEHQRIHSGEKPYACAACGKSFTFSSALRRHQRLHADADARPFQCAVCQKAFKRQSSLRSHELRHSGVRHPCPLCSKTFSSALELSYHVDVHSAERPYFCAICRKNLSNVRIFRMHMRKHEKQKTPQPLRRARPTHADSSEF